MFILFQLKKNDLILWSPVFIGAGILTYFGLPYNTNISLFVYAIIIIFSMGLIYFFKNIAYITIISLLVISGFGIAEYKTNNNRNSFISHSQHYCNINGKISFIVHKEKFLQLVVDYITSNKNKDRNFNKIKITVRTKIYDNFAIGDTVNFCAYLNPPQIAISPYSYDFARLAFFSGISAVGFATSKIILIRKPIKNAFNEKLLNFREELYDGFKNNMSNQESEIASAFIIGKRDGISKKILENFRNSGTAHLLAISGLHLSLVSFIFFYIIRSFLIFFALKYDIKKIAAFLAIFCSYCYLIIAGGSISAERAYIMSTFVFVAVLLDRKVDLIKIIMLSASIILCTNPVAIFNPSFQMSFSAVIVLASRIDKRKDFENIQPEGILLKRFYKLISYIKMIVVSSALASIATLPYTVFTFNYFSINGILANLFAIPLATLLIIPLGILASIIYSIPLVSSMSYPFYCSMEYSIDILIYLITKISHIPFSYYAVKAIPSISIIFITIGMLIICLIKSKYKNLGLISILIGIICALCYNTPDILINKQAVGIKGADNNLYFLSIKKQRYNFITNTWLRQNAQDKILLANNGDIVKEIKKDVFLLTREVNIIFNYSLYDLSHFHEIKYYDDQCIKTTLIVCMNKDLPEDGCDISLSEIEKNGTYFIYLNPYVVQHTRSTRKWHSF